MMAESKLVYKDKTQNNDTLRTTQIYLASSNTPKHTQKFTFFDWDIDILKSRLHSILVPCKITLLDREHLRDPQSKVNSKSQH